MAQTVFKTADFTAEPVDDSETHVVQPLLDRCEDYHQIAYGRPALPDQARNIPGERPPGLAPGQGHLFALRDAQGGLAGMLEALRDYPAPGEWYIGLFLLAPEARGQGRGEAVLSAYEGHVRANGGWRLRVAVVEHNTAGRHFWERVGFQPEQWVGPIEQGLRWNRVLKMTKDLG
ncbi:GNAT family N-acetyltransferase [Corallococcus carmarthensis]|uniref:GNAT family N-acetyltransferase n=1 Tax=Corallococcus carmarthensis TaxID=2316728 RepID=A0A3A8JR19_9BACT|nr:GNAT family N-acetyltransferase [Corallococcus carmarthensis]NOK21562.1 GNAT family N-acetyltransferase [Corallococcus carmarthensis]RKG94250.1 GNAT family N-acetyltransferase [Corallococcus carmarthensis]